jgi:hypothetical protein
MLLLSELFFLPISKQTGGDSYKVSAAIVTMYKIYNTARKQTELIYEKRWAEAQYLSTVAA